MDGIPGMTHEVQVEATFPNAGPVTVHDPIRWLGSDFASGPGPLFFRSGVCSVVKFWWRRASCF